MASFPSSLNSISSDEPSLNTPLLTAFAQEEEETDDEDLEEESEIEIEVEIEDGTAKIEAEFRDEELEFEMEWIDEQTTINEIALRTGLSLELIEASISFEFEDEEIEEEIEIEVEIENEIAEIKVEIDDEELEFEMEWIDEQTIINEIALRTGLSLELIEASISFEFEDEEIEEEDDTKQTKQAKLADKQAKKEAKLADKQAKKEAKLAEKQARFAEKLAEKEAKLSEKAQLSEERANKIIQKLEQKIQKMEERLQKLLDKYQSGKYFGNLNNVDAVTNSFTLSFDGIASQISDSSNEVSFDGKLFLENQYTGKHLKKFRITGGEIFVGDGEVYDIIFGKARLTSSGPGGEKNKMIVIAQASNGVDVNTLKLQIHFSEPFNSTTESVDLEILSPQSKIASQWFLGGTGTLGTTESSDSVTQDDTNNDAEPDVTIPDEDIPITTTLSVSTSESSYLTGDAIMISGTVDEIFEDTPVIMQLISPVDLIEIAQIDVESDGEYSHSVIAQGPQWLTDGTYTIKVFYGANNVAETSFEFLVEN